ncbi:MAG: flagellar export protein FliJ [Gammaproteobacteria bacterium]|nr:flagellar export protein FliJ [Gammaproteobacteria bacterium]MBU1556315.1 flagellar export protein FliJ [Gammaproteobacteria bacterium]MBU2069596.1 flagellar export protein FliJ [Gammaproteobacteria bacterium]MBU2184461.1 flagellar export protein FliJ [Gammaproteobacteria bacterium]MBU2205764.1 flagellar export protein FliJ [Gammaproteobacteria bacterium]
MINHRFSMLITIQQQREEKLQAQFVAAQQFYQQAEQKYQGLANYRTDYIRQSQQQGAAGLQSRQYSQFVNFIAKLDQAILQQGRAVHQARAAAEQRKQSWLAMQKKRKALELLVQRGEQAELLRQLKEEQKNADEYASQLYSRAQAVQL